MSLVRIKETGGIDSFVNTDHVALIQENGDRHTRVWLTTDKVFDVELSVVKAAELLGWRGGGTVTQMDVQI